MLMEKNKPQSMKDEEKIASIADPVARMMYAYQVKLRNEKKAKGKPMRFVNRSMLPRHG
jgi:hypothetical protein